jgi:hypothetical protein
MASFDYFFLKVLLDRCIGLKQYQNAKYVGWKKTGTQLILPEGKEIGFGGWADHASGAPRYFFGTFKYWGFTDIDEFYSLPERWRTKFFQEALEFVEGLFGKDLHGLYALYKELERTSHAYSMNSTNAQLQLLKAQDVEREVHHGIVQIAEKAMAKAKEMDNWKAKEVAP